MITPAKLAAITIQTRCWWVKRFRFIDRAAATSREEDSESVSPGGPPGRSSLLVTVAPAEDQRVPLATAETLLAGYSVSGVASGP